MKLWIEDSSELGNKLNRSTRRSTGTASTDSVLIIAVRLAKVPSYKRFFYCCSMNTTYATQWYGLHPVIILFSWVRMPSKRFGSSKIGSGRNETRTQAYRLPIDSVTSLPSSTIINMTKLNFVLGSTY